MRELWSPKENFPMPPKNPTKNGITLVRSANFGKNTENVGPAPEWWKLLMVAFNVWRGGHMTHPSQNHRT